MEREITNIGLSYVCPENWDKMAACPTGKFCERCQQPVIDFSDKNQTYFDEIQAKNQTFCGRFHHSQLNWVKIMTVAGLLHAADAAAQTSKPPTDSTQIHQKHFFGFVVEQMASFKGGEAALFQFLKQNIHYPSDTSLTGKVFVGFVIGTSGEVKNLKIKRGLHPSFDAEVLRAVALTSGMWLPTRQGGKPVETNFYLPVLFSPEDAPQK
jgi:TonB family protein